uniref:Short chain dehydrogenase reductase family n=2 Tax=Tetraselmis sp. GSL018 TaxID=582737 RepID=A0A061S8W3_9CHLO
MALSSLSLAQEGKVFLVTGSTDGIGLHTAKLLAAGGGSVIVHGRNELRVRDAVAEVERVARGNGKVASYTRDFSSLQEVKRLGDDVKRDFATIDVLVNNAGVYKEGKELSQDGFEMTYAVNVLAPFVLTSALHNIVTSRVVNTASISAGHSVDLDNLNQEKGFSSHNAYSLSKLLDIILTFELAERLKEKPFTVNTLDPGTVNTKMLLAGWGPIGIPVESADEFYVSTSPDLEGVSGEYFVGKRRTRAPAAAYDRGLRETLWRLWEQQTGVRF